MSTISTQLNKKGVKKKASHTAKAAFDTGVESPCLSQSTGDDS
jgi:hypothetical protein